MISMLDSAYAPSLDQAKAAAQSGVRLWGGYIPGGRVFHSWSRQDFANIRQAGMRPVFIHVGTDGKEAVANAWLCGAMTGDILCLDVEAGWNDTYSAAWASTVKAAGFETWLYGLGSETGLHGGPFDGLWTAAYTYPTVPNPSPKIGYQYWNSHTEFGVGVDRSVVDNHWASGPAVEDVMNIDIARAIVFVRLSGEGLLGDQTQIDAYAGPMSAAGANPEAKLTDLNSDIQANPNSLSNRVKSLEAKLVALTGAVTGLQGTVASLVTNPPTNNEQALTDRVSALENKLTGVKNAL